MEIHKSSSTLSMIADTKNNHYIIVRNSERNGATAYYEIYIHGQAVTEDTDFTDWEFSELPNVESSMSEESSCTINIYNPKTGKTGYIYLYCNPLDVALCYYEVFGISNKVIKSMKWHMIYLAACIIIALVGIPIMMVLATIL